jgi:hypothetical protein
MARVFNFYAGPATLPLPVLEAAQADLVDYRGSGLSLIETSHRSNDYDEVHASAQRLIRELLGVPDGYSVLFLGGGATMQFGTLSSVACGPKRRWTKRRNTAPSAWYTTGAIRSSRRCRRRLRLRPPGTAVISTSPPTKRSTESSGRNFPPSMHRWWRICPVIF